ncbi:MAG: prepilin peptidase [Patescibacteria group bacterium]|nr:prepilin peptidase [Patescibacteria group bacterium]
MTETFPFFVHGFFYFALGVSVGSLLNVVIDRSVRNESLFGRSYCDHCRKVLSWFELVPIFSFLFLKGKSRCCQKKLSFQYLIVETVTGLAFVFIYFWAKSLVQMLVLFGLVSLLIVIFVGDLKYQALSDYVIFSFFAFSFSYRFYLFFSEFWERELNLSADFFLRFLAEVSLYFLDGLIVCLPIFLIYFLSKERAMGQGDVYLSFAIGLLFGWRSGLIALYLAVVFGGLVGLILMLTGRARLKTKIAFGPFLVFGSFVMLFFQEKVYDFFKGIYQF